MVMQSYIAHLYEDLGKAYVRDLDGTFTIVIYDANQGRLIIAVDREASRPLYYYVNEERFLFASEAKAILEDRRVLRKINEQSVIEFMALRQVLEDRTLFEDIHFLPAGYMAVYQNGQLEKRAYWVPSFVQDPIPQSFDTYVDEVISALRKSLERQLYDDRPIGEFLSGGLDSRTLAGLVPSVNRKFHTFSFGPKDCWDVQFGMMVAERVGSQHHYLELEPDYLLNAGRKGVWITEGLMNVHCSHILSIIQQLKPHIDIAFFGHGRGDTVLSGLRLKHPMLRATSFDEIARLAYSTFAAQEPPARILSKPFHNRTKNQAFETLRRILGQYESNTFHGLVEAFAMQSYFPRSDNWGAIFSRTQVETRYPYSDNELCELVCRIPLHMRLNRQMHIEVVKRSRPDLAQIPWDTTGLPLTYSMPALILMRRIYIRARRELNNLTHDLIPAITARDRAYNPSWYRTVMRSWLEDLLLSEQTLARGYYDPDTMRQFVQEHLDCKADHSSQFDRLTTFELWNRLFIDQEVP